jgi:hypothetical protein
MRVYSRVVSALTERVNRKEIWEYKRYVFKLCN